MKIGDYVRTKEGYICKILEIHEEYDDEYLDWNDIGSASIRKSHIIKQSPNIIDLIEDGDYVNGMKVVERSNELMMADSFDLVEDEDIRTIVTKEQFESMQYNLESEVN